MKIADFYKIPILLSSLILMFHFSFAADFHSSIVQSGPQKYQFQFTFDKPQLIQNSDKKVYASYASARNMADASGAYVPVFTRLINLPGRQMPVVRILSQKEKYEKVDAYLFDPGHKDINFPASSVVIKYVGQFRHLSLFSLTITPVRYDPSGSVLSWISEMKVEIIPDQVRINSARAIPRNGKSIEFLGNKLLNGKTLYENEASAPTGSLKKQTSGFNFNPALNHLNVYKLYIDREGLYKITYEDLVEADYPVDKVNPLNLKVFNKGVQVPIYFKGGEDGTFDEKDYFEFWAEKNEKTFMKKYPDMYEDPFSDVNVYWLVEGTSAGQRLTEESGGLVNTGNGYIFSPYAYTETLHFERDSHRENFGHSPQLLNRPSYELDHWFYDSGISAPEGVAYDFYVPHPFESGNNVQIKAMFRGKSFYSSDTNPLSGHQVQLKLRGKGDKSKLIGQIDAGDGWRDQDMRVITNADSAVKLPQSILNNGNNRLEVDMFQTGVTDIVLLNWFDLTYLRKYRAYQDYIKFHVDPEFFNNTYVNYGDNIQINVDGFSNSDIEVYKIGISKIINSKIDFVTDNHFSSYSVSFQDQIFDPNVQYVALTEEAKKKPLQIKKFIPWNSGTLVKSLFDYDNKCDYLIITHDLFYKNALKLKELKEEAGFHPQVVTVENIYDYFNYGIKSPLAIKNFIKFVYRNWDQSTPLQYVVLIGKGSYDYKGKIKKDADLVPTLFFQTEKFGAASSDFQYALIDGDDYIPDVIVSRIPAATNEDLLNYLDKVEHFQNDPPPGPWRNRALFISGNDAGSGDREYLTRRPIFRGQNLRLINYRLPQHIFANRLNTVKDTRISGYDPNFGGTTDLIEDFDEGLSFVNFLGHGGGGIWADVSLLDLDDVDRMNNGYKLPFVASMTCFTGAYENPGRIGLAEKMLLAPQKGAIGILAASGVGWKYNDFATEWGLFDYLWDDHLSFGEAVDLMKILYFSNSVYNTEEGSMYTPGYGGLKYSMVSQYNLFGDPSLKIQKPDYSLAVHVTPQSISLGDTVQIDLVSPYVSSANGQLKITDQRDSLLFSRDFTLTSGSYHVAYAPDSTAAGQILRVKAYVNDGESDAAGWNEFAVEKPIVTELTTEPARPKVGEPISFILKVKSDQQISSIKLNNFRDFNRSNVYAGTVDMIAVNDSLYRSVQPFTGFSSGGKKYFDVRELYRDSLQIVYRYNTISIWDPRPDLLIDPKSIQYAGTDQLKLQFTVENQSDTSLTDVPIACYDDYGIAHATPFVRLFTPLNARERKTLTVRYDSLQYRDQRTFRIIIDPDHQISERNEDNNRVEKQLSTDYIWVKKVLGTTLDGVSNQSIPITDKVRFFIAENGLSGDAVVHFERTDIHQQLKENGQGGLSYIPLSTTGDTLAIALKFPADLANKTVPAQLTAMLDSTKYQADKWPDISFYKYDLFLNLWVKIPTTVNGSKALTHIDASGTYTLFYGNDHKSPFIEVTANGRPLIKNTLVVRNPSLSVLLQDENGVNYTHSLNLKIDDRTLITNGRPLIPGEVSIPDSLKNARSVSVTTSPKLDPGLHHITVEVADINGNVSSQEFNFQVNAGFDIRVFGNYPNPFADQTIISFYVDSDNEIDDFSIKIYTTSGRLIRRNMLDLDESVAGDNVRMPSYHELIWDGTDDDGAPVANGVYFAVVSGRYKGKTVKHTLKIARLR